MEVDTKAMITEAKERQQVVLSRITEINKEEAKLEEEKQLALQEVLRSDGEIRLLQSMEGNGKGVTPPEKPLTSKSASDA